MSAEVVVLAGPVLIQSEHELESIAAKEVGEVE